MKCILTLIIILLSWNQNLYSQDIYLIDSTTTITIFSGIPSGVNRVKYSYDEKLRLISESSEFLNVIYQYFGEYDYTKSNYLIENEIVTSEIEYLHNDDGFVIQEFWQQYNYATEELQNSANRVYERDNENRIVSDKYFVINEANDEIINWKREFEYNDYGISKETYTQYDAGGGSIFFVTIIQNFYLNDLLDKIITENFYPNQTTHSVKEFNYDEGLLISTEETQYTNSQPGYSLLYNYEYSDEGFYIYEFSKFDINADYEEGSIQYQSRHETPFYEFDTTRFIFQFEGEIFDEQTLFNSVNYSATEDTAVVRREQESGSFDNQFFLQVSKEIHLKYEDPLNISTEHIDVAKIFPNPVAVDNPIKLEELNKNIRSYRMLNYLGQNITHGSVWNHEGQIIQAPAKSGNYLIQFYDSEDTAFGKLYKIIVF